MDIDTEFLNIYVGRHWSEIMVEDNPIRPKHEFRLIRPNDMMTLDLHLNRINIYVDEDGIVKEFDVG